MYPDVFSIPYNLFFTPVFGGGAVLWIEFNHHFLDIIAFGVPTSSIEKVRRVCLEPRRCWGNYVLFPCFSLSCHFVFCFFSTYVSQSRRFYLFLSVHFLSLPSLLSFYPLCPFFFFQFHFFLLPPLLSFSTLPRFRSSLLNCLFSLLTSHFQLFFSSWSLLLAQFCVCHFRL